MTGRYMPIRAVPKYSGPDLYFDPANLTADQHKAMIAELESRGYFVQYLHLDDPTRLLVEAEIRKRIEAEQEAGRNK